MATGPLSDQQVDALRAERDALARRCAEAEQRVAELSAELDAARARLAELENGGDQGFSLFDQPPKEEHRRGLSADGSDPRVLSLVLAAIAVVAGMVALLALVNGNLLTPFGLVMVALTLVLAFAAARTRVQPVEAHVRGGIVYIEKGGSTYRFDLSSAGTNVEVQGKPGDAFWQVRFLRRHLDPFVVDADMVDPEEFMRQLREHRPEL
ncbi:MAG TPA: hypothetical protein VD859_12035 [Nocardioides sp.]|nr:hypothetical protein [Nocardioides sp.]